MLKILSGRIGALALSAAIFALIVGITPVISARALVFEDTPTRHPLFAMDGWVGWRYTREDGTLIACGVTRHRGRSHLQSVKLDMDGALEIEMAPGYLQVGALEFDVAISLGRHTFDERAILRPGNVLFVRFDRPESELVYDDLYNFRSLRIRALDQSRTVKFPALSKILPNLRYCIAVVPQPTPS